jgi:hypothetical protein
MGDVSLNIDENSIIELVQNAVYGEHCPLATASGYKSA